MFIHFNFIHLKIQPALNQIGQGKTPTLIVLFPQKIETVVYVDTSVVDFHDGTPLQYVIALMNLVSYDYLVQTTRYVVVLSKSNVD